MLVTEQLVFIGNVVYWVCIEMKSIRLLRLQSLFLSWSLLMDKKLWISSPPWLLNSLHLTGVFAGRYLLRSSMVNLSGPAALSPLTLSRMWRLVLCLKIVSLRLQSRMFLIQQQPLLFLIFGNELCKIFTFSNYQKNLELLGEFINLFWIPDGTGESSTSWLIFVSIS